VEWINEKASVYSALHTSGEEALLMEISAFTFANHPDPGMLSGHVQGKFLQMISAMIAPNFVLEIGTLTGYSAICLAEGLTENGELHTIELREKDASTARDFFIRSRFANRIRLHLGEALTVIEKLKAPWDLVFIDADKINYVNYYEAVMPQVRPGGFILADNVLFHGEVLEDNIKGKNAIAIKSFNEHIRQDNRVECVLLTIRDGLMLIRKK
jgi:caffeoyl-CoA O-methyltransferase